MRRPSEVDDKFGVRPDLLTRREILRRGSLIAGAVGTAGLVQACAGGPAPSWTFPAAAAASDAPVTAAPGGTLLAPSPFSTQAPAPTAAASAVASPSLSPSGSPSASPSGSAAAARDPSPADIATPPAYRPRQATPVEFSLESFDGPGQTILIAPGKTYNSMNFAGQVPAPTLRVSQGQVVHFTLTNRGTIPHSIDFHAARTPWDKNYQTVPAGQSFAFDWMAADAGVFLYHCGAQPVIMHIGDGMFGAVIVDPVTPRAPAREYLLVENEWYGTGGDYQAMLNNPPDVVAFNGQAFRYRTNPLSVTAGELLRLFLVNAGPSNVWAFHVIGALIDHYEQDGNPANAQGLHQSVEVLPGGGALVELTIPQSGQYPFVTHKMNDMEKGALGLFQVS
jgi:nitrite reductase (NO-forming)